ncbi:MAG: hypothetical protein HC911_17420 [Chloroflexaceae bacterium]|nr:hypothetical protein [Chloroflexaceae bacterium]
MILGNFREAQSIWESIQQLADQTQHWINVRYYTAKCLFHQGLIADSKGVLLDVIQHTIKGPGRMNFFDSQIALAEIFLLEGESDKAQKRLEYIQKAPHLHRYQIAQTQRLSGQLHTLRGELPEAHASLTEAIDLFERMGMRRELAEAREELARLEARMAEADE